MFMNCLGTERREERVQTRIQFTFVTTTLFDILCAQNDIQTCAVKDTMLTLSKGDWFILQRNNYVFSSNSLFTIFVKIIGRNIANLQSVIFIIMIIHFFYIQYFYNFISLCIVYNNVLIRNVLYFKIIILQRIIFRTSSYLQKLIKYSFTISKV